MFALTIFLVSLLGLVAGYCWYQMWKDDKTLGYAVLALAVTGGFVHNLIMSSVGC